MTEDEHEIYKALLMGICERFAHMYIFDMVGVCHLPYCNIDRNVRIRIYLGRVIIWGGNGFNRQDLLAWKCSIEDPSVIEKAQAELIKRGAT